MNLLLVLALGNYFFIQTSGNPNSVGFSGIEENDSPIIDLVQDRGGTNSTLFLIIPNYRFHNISRSKEYYFKTTYLI